MYQFLEKLMYQNLKTLVSKRAMNMMLMAMLLFVVTLIVPAVTFAAAAVPTATSPFFTVYTIVIGWLNGPLALTLSLAAVIIGLGVGIVRQNPMPAVAGIAFAVFSTVLPNIVISIMGAVV